MSDTATKADIQVVSKDIDEVLDVLRDFTVQVDRRFTALEERQLTLETKFDRLINTIDGFVARIDKYETEQAARYSQFEKLLIWARKVSEKTGIPLENL